jgi:hypothetical protein
MPLKEGWQKECVMGDDEWQNCILSGGANFEDGICFMTWEEFEAWRPVNCAAEGGVWTEIQEGWFECYHEGDEWLECMMQGRDMTMWWNDETDE